MLQPSGRAQCPSCCAIQGKASLHGNRAQQKLSCCMRRRHVPCQCLSPQKPDLSLSSRGTPVHIFGVQHLERQVPSSSSACHSICTHIAFLLAMPRTSLVVQGTFLVIPHMQCFSAVFK